MIYLLSIYVIYHLRISPNCRHADPAGPEFPAQAALRECVQQPDPGDPARRLHQHEPPRQAHPHQEQDHQARPLQPHR